MRLIVNGTEVDYTGDPERRLLSFLREDRGLTAAKNGCSGQGACGACLVEVDGRAALACVTPMRKVAGKNVVTLEGLPDELKRTLGRAFVDAGAVQCGFCTPGFLLRTKILLATNPHPTREEVTKAVRPHLCRCTGYVKLVDAILHAAAILRGEAATPEPVVDPTLGLPAERYHAYERAVGTHPFADDLRPENGEGLLHGALVFSEHPRAVIRSMDTAAAQAAPGVVRVLTADDIPGERHVGMFAPDWPVYVATDETTRTVADVLACVVAETREAARAAAELVAVEYEVLDALTDMRKAEGADIVLHHTHPDNLLAVTDIRRGGDVDAALATSAHVVSETFSTAAIEHGFIEPECSYAEPWESDHGPGVRFYTQGQGIYHDRDDVARMLGLLREAVRATLVDAGGAFGGKEDLTVQTHAALAAWLTKRPVSVKLSRPQSLRMHPKRHPMRLTYTVGCDEAGRLTALKVRILGDTGAYASVGKAVMARVATHAGGAYHIPVVDVQSRALFTNNIPNGAMRGFGVNQAAFAMESMVERLCTAGGFDPLAMRYDNAVDEGRMVTTGQVLGTGVGLRACIDALREPWQRVKDSGRAALACAIKNCGIGNGILEECTVRVEVHEDGTLTLHHGWSEMGQGIHTMAAQLLAHALGMDDITRIHVDSDTAFDAPAGATTASRGTFQLGHAVLDCAEAIKTACNDNNLSTLAGRTFSGSYRCDWTSATGEPGEVVNHVSYSYGAHLALLNPDGSVAEMVAAHDAGQVVNRAMCEGQIEGGVVMGLGAALSESFVLQDGYLTSDKLRDCGLPRSTDVPKITVITVDNTDPEGPLGAKGVGEVCCIPTAPAVACAYYRRDGILRTALPLAPPAEPVGAAAPDRQGDSPWTCY